MTRVAFKISLHNYEINTRRLFVATLFNESKNKKQPICPPIGTCLKKLCYTHPPNYATVQKYENVKIRYRIIYIACYLSCKSVSVYPCICLFFFKKKQKIIIKN